MGNNTNLLKCSLNNELIRKLSVQAYSPLGTVHAAYFSMVPAVKCWSGGGVEERTDWRPAAVTSSSKLKGRKVVTSLQSHEN